MDQRIVIAGGGRVGLRTAELLENRGHAVTIIERDPDRCERIADEYVATVIEGDATRPSILQQASLERADTLMGLTGESGTNLAVCLAAERVEPDLRTVMRTGLESADEYAEYVDTVIYPEQSAARAAANAVEPEFRSLEGVSGDIDVIQVTVSEGAPVANRTLEAVSLPRGSLVVSDADQENIAKSDTELVPGRSYIVAVKTDVVEEVLRLFRG